MNDLNFSVIIPACNAENFILSAVSSVVTNGGISFEILVIDDGSVDMTAEKVLALDQPNVKCYTIPHCGAQRARLYGTERARGEYLLYLDADDSFVPETLDAVWDALQKFPCDMLLFGSMQYSLDGKCTRQSGEFGEGYVSSKDLCIGMIRDRIVKSLCRKAIRRELAQAYSSFVVEHSIRYGEDILLTLDFASRCRKIYMIDHILHKCYFRPKSVMHQFYPLKYLDRETMYYAILHYGRIMGISRENCRELAEKYLHSAMRDCRIEIEKSDLDAEEKLKLLYCVQQTDEKIQ